MASTTTAFITIPNSNKPLIINPSKTSKKLPIFQPTNPSIKTKPPTSWAKTTAIFGTIVANMTSSPVVMAAKQIAESPEQDNRGLALLIPVIPAIGWVLYNILGPALNQLNRMRSEKGIVLGLGLSGSFIAALSARSAASAAEAAEAVVENGGDGNRGLLVLFVTAAVLLEVILFSTMQSGYESKRKGSSD